MHPFQGSQQSSSLCRGVLVHSGEIAGSNAGRDYIDKSLGQLFVDPAMACVVMVQWKNVRLSSGKRGFDSRWRRCSETRKRSWRNW
jgi:hypothetical protein